MPQINEEIEQRGGKLASRKYYLHEVIMSKKSIFAAVQMHSLSFSRRKQPQAHGTCLFSTEMTSIAANSYQINTLPNVINTCSCHRNRKPYIQILNEGSISSSGQ